MRPTKRIDPSDEPEEFSPDERRAWREIRAALETLPRDLAAQVLRRLYLDVEAAEATPLN
jgi:DNA-directed RNA polymerase specialized sigma24 family protein